MIENARFKIGNPYEITFEKNANAKEFDPDVVSLFRLSLVPKLVQQISARKPSALGPRKAVEDQAFVGDQYYIAF
eukprot:CAMPEP_0176344620 /NCGR_PEP_ID=MMETSP0126-20121128/4834_1 /TAXON_ID=141414 ORGANISM="Strombidinopsis acuminatum, Strain SPMC142" /NCGR_SAMPLE_ID=MMETSP0126 /ASSEMBLY_ACC=CAM_ASM_000229 /LENGTH=74 /DNA_ID=CAMNT_0017691167 /DNA_START=126 /DNA_END=353 /DNA_ORIENTATION=-